jgi:hypothetical protein
MTVANKNYSDTVDHIIIDGVVEEQRRSDEVYCPILRDGRGRCLGLMCGENIHFYYKEVSVTNTYASRSFTNL